MSRRSEIMRAKPKRSKNFIAGAIEHPGGLHRALGVPTGKKIPVGMIESHTHAPGRMGKMARLAMTLRHMQH